MKKTTEKSKYLLRKMGFACKFALIGVTQKTTKQ